MFDTVTTIEGCLTIFAGMIETMTVKTDVMESSTKKDFSNATELADYLASKGMPFRQAHEVVGKLVLECIQQGMYLMDLPLENYQAASDLFEEDIYHVLDPKTAVNRRNSAGGTGFDQVRQAILKVKEDLKQEVNA